MARHRNVRTMNYEDECYDDDDYLGHSVEDNYCISPGTAAQFTFNREKDFDLSTYMGNEKIPEEEEGFDSDTDQPSLNDSQGYKKPDLSDVEQAKLNSCLEEIRNILGDSTPDHILYQTIIKNKFDLQASLNELLKTDDAPKPQRQPRQNRRNRSQGDDDDDDLDSFMESLESESPEKTHFLSYQNKHLGILKFGKLSPSVESPITNIQLKSEKNQTTSESADSSLTTGVSCNPTKPKGKVGLQGQSQGLGGLSLSNLTKQHSAAGQGVSLASLAAAKPDVKSLEGKKESGSIERKANVANLSQQAGQAVASGTQRGEPSLAATPLTGGSSKSSGLSLADLINKKQSGNKPDVVTKSKPQASRVSLADLAGQRSQPNLAGETRTNTNTKVSLVDLAAKSSGSSKPGLGDLAAKSSGSSKPGLGDLAAKSSGSSKPGLGDLAAKSSSTLKLVSMVDQPSSKIGKSLADLASQHKTTTEGTDLILQKPRAATTDAVIGQMSGLSLADLVKSRKTPQQKGPVSSVKSLRNLTTQQQKTTKMNTLSDLTNQSRSKGLETGSGVVLSAGGKVQSVSSVQRMDSTVDESVLSDQFSALMNTSLELFLDDNTDLMDKIQKVSPSILAKTISFSHVCSKRPSAKKTLRFPKFSYQAQMSEEKENLIKANEIIKPFDFSTPSPDDLVKQKQSRAFTRSGR